jgi:hypothetical protein
MIAYLKPHPSVRAMLVEKTNRLYRNLKDWLTGVTVDELDVEMHFPKEGVAYRASRASSEPRHGSVSSQTVRSPGTTPEWAWVSAPGVGNRLHAVHRLAHGLLQLPRPDVRLPLTLPPVFRPRATACTWTGYVPPTGSAVHPGATVNLKLTMHLDHSVGADHCSRRSEGIALLLDR